MEQSNPFALVRASDYTDEQINSLWVELGATFINTIIEPQSKISKFILGGKGTGKTHLLRYYSYQVARLRFPNASGLSILGKHNNFLAIFIRATGLDAARFEGGAEDAYKWQQLFGVYLELRLVEGVLDALCDIKRTSPDDQFDDHAFIVEIAKSIVDQSIIACRTVAEFREWIIQERRRIDDAVNNAAFVGTLDLRVPFSIGSLCLPVSRALGRWNLNLSAVPLIYLIDEIENLTESQQQVLNSLIRYGEGLATFRVTGRLYAMKTAATLADGEENREGAEFKTTILDDILRDQEKKYREFARKFVTRRLGQIGGSSKRQGRLEPEFDPSTRFEEISSSDYYSEAIARLKLDTSQPPFIQPFVEALKLAGEKDQITVSMAREVADNLVHGIPLLLQKLNLLLFCKKYKKGTSALELANKIRSDSLEFLDGQKFQRSSYATAYGHWAADLFAQLCRESKKADGVPYAGFETFVRMSSGNPRNLLIVLGKAYEIAAFKEFDFINGPRLPISMQTEAAIEAARFMYESDTNYGRQSAGARDAVNRLALILRTARYALNIPEVSPLAVSFYDGDLTENAKRTLNSALNYSLVFEIHDGRPDRNSQRLNRKIQLNPLLSPRWGLPVSRRGDISLSRELVNAVFDSSGKGDTAVFDVLLNGLSSKWNYPFTKKRAASYLESLPLPFPS